MGRPKSGLPSLSWIIESRSALNREQLIQFILDQPRIIEELPAEIEQIKRQVVPFPKAAHKADPEAPGTRTGDRESSGLGAQRTQVRRLTSVCARGLRFGYPG